MCVFSRWNMMSCFSDASRQQTDSAIKPYRHPIVPLWASGPAAACPAQLLRPIWQLFWKMASSLSTRLSSKRSSPASRRPKRTLAKTNVQTGTVIPRALPNDCIVHHPGTRGLHSFVSLKVFWQRRNFWGGFAIQKYPAGADATSALRPCAS